MLTKIKLCLLKIHTMKLIPIKILILSIAFLSVFSCKKDDDTPVDDPKSENRKALGTSAKDILSQDNYKILTVEFVYSNGFRPDATTLSGFRTVIEERINKPEGIIFIETEINAPQGAPFTTSEIREIENERRTKYTEGNNIALYVFFANGNADTDTNTSVTLGTAYQNTSIVIYEKTILDLAASTSDPEFTKRFLEANTLHHEFGHILGLVNIQNDDIHPTGHLDTVHSKHCVITDCLMYFELNEPFRILQKVEQRGAVPQFDSLCIEDLRAKGGR